MRPALSPRGASRGESGGDTARVMIGSFSGCKGFCTRLGGSPTHRRCRRLRPSRRLLCATPIPISPLSTSACASPSPSPSRQRCASLQAGVKSSWSRLNSSSCNSCACRTKPRTSSCSSVPYPPSPTLYAYATRLNLLLPTPARSTDSAPQTSQTPPAARHYHTKPLLRSSWRNGTASSSSATPRQRIRGWSSPHPTSSFASRPISRQKHTLLTASCSTYRSSISTCRSARRTTSGTLHLRLPSRQQSQPHHPLRPLRPPLLQAARRTTGRRKAWPTCRRWYLYLLCWHRPGRVHLGVGQLLVRSPSARTSTTPARTRY
mmetsp:Transcript_20822/g.63710  ORF Transcript_20822/g.63710 Transcript_20822/m.63710 type:complete len:319 (-) Transcript_20822:2133-3089(-)